MTNLKKLAKITKNPKVDILKKVEERIKNRRWLKYSQEVALLVLEEMDEENISQKELAKRMNVSPQYVNKLLRGKEKLNFETVTKLEDALDVSLMNIEKIKNKDTKKECAETKVITLDVTRILKDDYYENFELKEAK